MVEGMINFLVISVLFIIMVIIDVNKRQVCGSRRTGNDRCSCNSDGR